MVDDDAAEPGAERIAEIEGGDVEAGGEALAARPAPSPAPTAAAARRWRRRRRRAGRQHDRGRPWLCSAAVMAKQHEGERDQRAEQRRRQAAVGQLAAEQIADDEAAAEHQQDRRDRGLREAGDRGQDRLDVGEDGEHAGKAEHGHGEAEQHLRRPARRAPRRSEIGLSPAPLAAARAPRSPRRRPRRSPSPPRRSRASRAPGRARRRRARRAGSATVRPVNIMAMAEACLSSARPGRWRPPSRRRRRCRARAR